MADEVTDDWISDNDSYFRHLSRIGWGASHATARGINLGRPGRYLSRDEMHHLSEGKPSCSACIEGVRV